MKTEGPGDGMLTAGDDGRRRTAAALSSLLLHGAVLAALLGRGVARLTLEPPPLLVSLVDAPSLSASPGSATAAVVEALPRTQSPPPPPAPRPLPPSRPAPGDRFRVRASRPDVATPAKESGPADPAESGEARGQQEASPVDGTGAGGESAAAAIAAAGWAGAGRASYEALLTAWMNRNKEYPLLARRRGIEGSAVVRVRIDRRGRLVSRDLDRSSGEPLLDQAALEMVARSNPFPAVPGAYVGDSFEFVAPIEYRLR